MKFFLFLIFSVWVYQLNAQNPACYKIYNASGKEVSFEDMVKASSTSDMVFFGEFHNDPIAHWFELLLTEKLFVLTGNKLILGAEMFESDNQLIFDEYQKGLIPAKKFEEEARVWPNYSTDYKPIVEYAITNKIPFIATNTPRRYASIVSSSGLDGLLNLSDDAKKLIAPLPIKYDENLNCYKSMLQMGGMSGMKGGKTDPSNFPKAQAIKDATMAHFIMTNYQPGKLLLHFNGSFHSDNHEGIVWHLKQAKNDLKITVISTVNQKDISKLEEEYLNQGDFILCVPENMTKTN
ncbi:MAG: iron-regulated protein [Bacteroidetes bacterium HGW-Bacteroidetes-21]|jgi:uncharacterized iron-regulated protein|nr:MAG: iron-regulated protein [Bacteroidetes bacterium HGW-Bacteroidetes-21]